MGAGVPTLLFQWSPSPVAVAVALSAATFSRASRDASPARSQENLRVRVAGLVLRTPSAISVFTYFSENCGVVQHP